MLQSTFRTTVATAALGLSLIASAAATAAPAPAPVASATYGRAAVQLLPDVDRPGRLQLTYAADADTPPTAVDVDLPASIKPRNAAVGLGLDATGLLTAVVAGSGGLHWVRVTRPADGVQRLAKTSGAESPAIYKGRVAYVCQDGMAVCQASLRTKSRKVVHREPKGSPWRIHDVRIGKDDALAVAAERDGALGASRIQLKRRSGKAKTIAEANLDGAKAVLLSDVSPAGDHVNVLRRDYAPDGEPAADPKDTVSVFTLPGGKRVR